MGRKSKGAQGNEGCLTKAGLLIGPDPFRVRLESQARSQVLDDLVADERSHTKRKLATISRRYIRLEKVERIHATICSRPVHTRRRQRPPASTVCSISTLIAQAPFDDHEFIALPLETIIQT